jgi:hypothetical protein
MIDLELFNKLRKESGDEWYVFIGTIGVPDEWKRKCEMYSVARKTWENWCDGFVHDIIYRIRVEDIELKKAESLPKVISLPIDWHATDHPRVHVHLEALCSHVMCSIGQVHYHNGHEYRLFGFGFCMWEENELSEAYFHAPFVVGRTPEKCVYAYFKRID